MNLDNAMTDPASEFDSPEDVLNADLTKEQKLQILKQWKLDAELLATAASENMAGGEPNMLHRVAAALSKLEQQSPLFFLFVSQDSKPVVSG